MFKSITYSDRTAIRLVCRTTGYDPGRENDRRIIKTIALTLHRVASVIAANQVEYPHSDTQKDPYSCTFTVALSDDSFISASMFFIVSETELNIIDLKISENDPDLV